jgi:hypothetical protein
LALYPIIAFFVLLIPMKAGVCVPECTAFLAMCDLADLLQCIPLGVVSSEKLLVAVEAVLAHFVLAKWQHRMTKKFHWLLHMPDHLRRFGMLPACWSLERKHKLIKVFANQIKNTVHYEHSMLKEVLNQELHNLTMPDVFNKNAGLVSPHNASKKLRTFVSETLGVEFKNPEDCLTCSVARLSPAGFCSWRDVVLFKAGDGLQQHWEAGELWRHFTVHGRQVSLISVWKLLAYESDKSIASWQSQENPMYLGTSDILCCLTYKRDKSGLVTTLIPHQYRY